MREELKGRNLSFTEIAKLVGENWQNLTAAEKEPFESQAQAIKDKYLSDLANYKKTGEYRKYMSYLQEFKAKHASPSQGEHPDTYPLDVWSSNDPLTDTPSRVADKDGSKRLRLSESGGQGRCSPGATPTRTSRSGSGADSRKGSEPPTSRQRVDSAASMSESQFSVSLGPSASIASPEEPILSPVISDSERHSSDLSPTFKTEPRDQVSLPGPRHHNQGEEQSREQPSTHRHLPSLSDVFDGQGLPGGMRPSNEQANGYRFPGAHVVGSPGPPLSHGGGDARPAPLTNGHSYVGNPPAHPSFGHPRPPVDGPLPIHALLASKPEPPFHNHQPPHIPPGNPYHTDQKPRLVHQPPNGAAGLPMINGASSAAQNG